ncbi:MAG: hypothetical protein J5562_02510 [Clostridia bacterium]|nr:hypothetical protein [Clostridia bacterium]
MRKKDYKGRCVKRKFQKSKDIVKTFDKIQSSYADFLESNDEIKSFSCNVLLLGIENDSFTTDFLCLKADGTYMVRECVFYLFFFILFSRERIIEI